MGQADEVCVQTVIPKHGALATITLLQMIWRKHISIPFVFKLRKTILYRFLEQELLQLVF